MRLGAVLYTPSWARHGVGRGLCTRQPPSTESGSWQGGPSWEPTGSARGPEGWGPRQHPLHLLSGGL